MWEQISAITWAQFRITRNHLPRTSAGTIFSWLLLSAWYGLYASAAFFLVVKIPDLPIEQLAKWLPVGLLGVFLFWQLVPLFTLSSGWSLQLSKLRIYPVSSSALFGIEVLLRITSAPEMIILLGGAMLGLFGRSDIPALSPLVLLVFVLLNLFFQLAIRDLILHSFERNRFRELFAVLVIGLAILPQLLLRTALGRAFKPYFLSAARNFVAPWYDAASLSLGRLAPREVALLLFWIALSFAFARWMFGKSLVEDESFQARAAVSPRRQDFSKWKFSGWPSRMFRDPLGALLQKEIQSLIRMPRFRVLFGMACVLGVVVFIPVTLNGSEAGSEFMRNNLIPVVNLYGLLLLSDTLLLNAFGLDRGAVQVYFVTPVALDAVLMAKNLAAIFFVVLQSIVILVIASLARANVTPLAIVSGVLASAVVTIFLLAAGNFTSLSMARPIDPRQTFKKQAGAKMQLWLLACSAGLFVLVGFAFLARYALDSDWVFLVVLSFEFLVGLITYRFGLASAVERGWRDREIIVQMLSKSESPVSLS